MIFVKPLNAFSMLKTCSPVNAFMCSSLIVNSDDDKPNCVKFVNVGESLNLDILNTSSELNGLNASSGSRASMLLSINVLSFDLVGITSSTSFIVVPVCPV